MNPLVAIVAKHSGVSPARIIGRRRTLTYSRARWVLYHLMKTKGLNMFQISKILKRDHAGIAYGLNRLTIERGFYKHYDDLIKACENDMATSEQPEYMI